jgi:hypothetical protein
MMGTTLDKANHENGNNNENIEKKYIGSLLKLMEHKDKQVDQYYNSKSKLLLDAQQDNTSIFK